MMKQLTILIVDDELLTVRILSANLKASGYQVLTAYDGQEALKIMEKQPVDLVLLDILMPGPDGFDVCRKIRETYNVPVIVISAQGQEKDKLRALNSGAQDYITKPFGMAELLARTRANLSHPVEISP